MFRIVQTISSAVSRMPAVQDFFLFPRIPARNGASWGIHQENLCALLLLAPGLDRMVCRGRR
jgi:hypothetical protein